MSFPSKVQEDALVACARHCCLCHKFCGLKMELHHIKQKAAGGIDSFENCLPVCFDCHADMRSYDHKHPKGTKYTETELIRHRDAWYLKVQGSPVSGYDAASLELDRGVFLAIVKLLPYRGIVSLLQTHSFGGAFRNSIFVEFDRFVFENDNPAMEFLDADLEGIRVTLVEAVNEFSHYLAANTWPVGNSLQSVPDEWLGTQQKRYDEVVRQLDEKSTEVANLYAALVREARRRLGIQPPETAG